MGTLLIIISNRHLVDIFIFGKRPYGDTSHCACSTKYNNMHYKPMCAYATSTTECVETVFVCNSCNVSSRRLRMVSISSRVMTSGGSTRITRELFNVPEMSTPRLNRPEATA